MSVRRTCAECVEPGDCEFVPIPGSENPKRYWLCYECRRDAPREIHYRNRKGPRVEILRRVYGVPTPPTPADQELEHHEE